MYRRSYDMTETKSTSTDYNEWYSKVVDINEKFICIDVGIPTHLQIQYILE